MRWTVYIKYLTNEKERQRNDKDRGCDVVGGGRKERNKVSKERIDENKEEERTRH